MRLRDKLEIALACALVPPLLEICPASRALGWLGRVPRRSDAPVPPDRLAWHVDRLLYRAPWIWRRTCLRRAAVLATLLRRQGRTVEVVLGVRRGADGTLEAHAWLRGGDVEPKTEPYLDDGVPIAGFERLRAGAGE